MAVKNRLGELVAIKARREKRKITQRTIAHETGISLQTVSQYMLNKSKGYRPDVMERFADYLDCELGDLFYKEQDDSQAHRRHELALAAV